MNKVKRNGSMLFAAFLILLLGSCNNQSNKNPYENHLGIRPATIAQLDTTNYTTIQWQDTIIHLGHLFYGDTILINYSFKNTGNGPLYLTEVRPGCGCTVADYPRNAILPGNSGILQAKYTTEGFPGPVKKYITVKSNTSNGIFHQLQFDATLSKDSLPHKNKIYIK
ncbi:MAG: DUF1573 domain-containing protein [Hydrotalea flava]|uniref:DUF1573 domain-containing protein n=1 Tax=Hydrotalea sp. TaxID=2881279 RepID=UPI0016B42312|nr:DUF1573 domain-containing protein [Hydrotalea sp.]NIM36409.1 DUF1573 domain-containing protein [Hydrotalea flava]NIM39267.1 DUF1573 domain-containing protein [Hydrotalea flava]NIN04503.1 DUF1573 domain-containing protein [Hydrotalea flava]NIN16128.1 DUF1573 domain-containing protein [Hydrotalea flava]NIO95193.1 DUF1573 domain-containing protein [Hydrotalea flava]